MITFQQLPYNNDIKVTLNATGLPVGKHALHIHTYGDLSDGCKSTGGQFPNNFVSLQRIKTIELLKYIHSLLYSWVILLLRKEAK